jgi:uncharacterized membrane protein
VSRRTKRNRRTRNVAARAPKDEVARTEPQQIVATFASQSYSGPIPPPAVLAEFERLVPGAASRIIGWAEQQTAHRIALESRVIDNEIRRSWAGLVAGFSFAVGSVAAGSWLIYLGHETSGTSVAVGTVVSVVRTARKITSLI